MLDAVNVLLDAAEKGDLNTVKESLAAGVNVDVRNSFEETPLFLASRHGHLEVVEYLLAQKADVHAVNSGNQSALHAACVGGCLQVVEKLLAHGADPKQLTSSKKTPMWSAVNYAHLDLIQYFVEKDLLAISDVKDLPFSSKHAKAKAAKIFALLFAKYSLLNETAQDELLAALIRYDALDGLSYLLKKFPALKANLNKHLELLVEGWELRNEANLIKATQISSKTLKKYAEEISGYTAAHPTLKFLLKQGLTMEALDDAGQTLLHYAAAHQFDEYEHLTHLKCLLDMGYPVDLVNVEGQTALQFAIEKGMLFHAFYLIYRGANVNHTDRAGKTALDYAKLFCMVGEEFDYSYNVEYRNDLVQVLQDCGAVR